MNSKLVSKKTDSNGNEILVYRHYVLAGMQFCYAKGTTKNNKMRKVASYLYEIIYSPLGETVSETKGKTVFY
jgi:hypothetical protein